jgi:hypothetical protein
VVLSVVVRSVPVLTAMNGMLVARPSRMTPASRCAAGSALTVRGGPSSVTTALWARARRARGSRVSRLNRQRRLGLSATGQILAKLVGGEQHPVPWTDSWSIQSCC